MKCTSWVDAEQPTVKDIFYWGLCDLYITNFSWYSCRQYCKILKSHPLLSSLLVMKGSKKFWRISPLEMRQVSQKQRLVFKNKTNIQLHLKRGFYWPDHLLYNYFGFNKQKSNLCETFTVIQASRAHWDCSPRLHNQQWNHIQLNAFAVDVHTALPKRDKTRISLAVETGT